MRPRPNRNELPPTVEDLPAATNLIDLNRSLGTYGSKEKSLTLLQKVAIITLVDYSVNGENHIVKPNKLQVTHSPKCELTRKLILSVSKEMEKLFTIPPSTIFPRPMLIFSKRQAESSQHLKSTFIRVSPSNTPSLE